MARNYDPEVKLGINKIDPLSEIRNAGIITNGDVFWVRDPDDSDYRPFKDQVGAAFLRDTPQAAVDLVETDQNDYVLLVPSDGGSPFDLGTALDLNEDRIHLLGVGGGAHNQSYAVTLRGNYGTSPDTEVVNVTGQGIEIGGVEVLGTLGTHAGGSMTNAVLYLGTAASGTAHNLWVHDSTIRMSGAHGTPPLVAGLAANDVRFDNVFFNAGVESHIDPVIMPHSSARWEFQDCRLLVDAQAVGDQFVTCGTGATDYILFDNCQFINRELGTLNASAFTGSVTLDNPVLLSNCTFVNVTQAGTDPTVYVSPAFSGTQAAIANVGIAIGTAAIIPA